MKVLSSDCNRVWLFDVEITEYFLDCGLACFMPNNNPDATFVIRGKEVRAMIPSAAFKTCNPLRIRGARLLLLN